MLENIVDIIFPIAIKKGLEVVTDVDCRIPRILSGDQGKIGQVITKLICNAIKFTDSGQIFIEVVYKREINGEYIIRFNIKDSGIGIKAGDLKKMFKKFTQLDMTTSRKYGGTGLGLSICKGLIKLMSGKIGIESKVDEGSNFWFEIPLFKSAIVFNPTKEVSKLKIASKVFAIIDQNQVSKKVLRNRIFNIFGARADEISQSKIQSIQTGDEKPIINQLKEGRYDVIIINHSNNGKLNGIKIAKLIKSTQDLSNIILILVVSYYEKSKILKKDLEIFSSIVIKPITENSFIDAILDANNISHQEFARLALMVDMNQKNSEVYKILVCEDNETNSKVIVVVLTKMGYEVDVTSDGQEGFDKLFNDTKETQYDIILMDCMMPKMDGFMATIKIRKEEKLRNISHIPIIALTANTSESDKDRCFEVGMDDFLSKPIQGVLVAQVIKRHIDKKFDKKYNANSNL